MVPVVFKGTYDRTFFKNPDTGYKVISVKTSDTEIPQKARSSYKVNDQLIRFTATGNGLPETSAVEIMLTGEWDTSKYGCQLKVETWDAVVPQTKQGMYDYLCCGIIKGLSSQAASQIVERFGVDSMQIIKNEPQRLMEIPGISQDALKALNATHQKDEEIRALEDFFKPFGVTKKEVLKVYEYFGPGCLPQIKRSPFELCRVDGFGFKRVDTIAKTMNCPLNDPLRVKAAAFLVLEKYSARGGHLYLQFDDLCKKTLAKLNSGISDKSLVLVITEVAEMIDAIAERKELIAEDGCVYLPRHYRNELYVARRIAGILISPKRGCLVHVALERAKKELDITPSELQEAAVVMAFQQNLSIMTGLPGTGKTTVLKLIIAVYHMLYPNGVIMLAAPTGRASRRMAESTGFEEAKTMHSMMGLLTNDEQHNHLNSREPIEADFLIIDEVSMVDMWLARELFSRLKPGATLFLVGDAGQLPSVGPGNVFHEMIETGLIQVTALTQIFRQAEGSLISYNAQLINEGKTKLVYGRDFYWEEFFCVQDTIDYLVECYLQEISEHGVANVQILSPYLKEGIASVEKLNILIRDMVNPAAETRAEVRIGKKLFREKDRIMQTRNKNGISNGDIGFIHSIRDHDGPDTSVVIEFSGERVVEYHPTELGIIELSYAVTTHKAMGSEFEIVLMPVLSDHKGLLDRRLLNTAITRARLRDYLAGESHALVNAIRNDKSSNRNTRLGFQIKKQYVKLMEANAPPVSEPKDEQLQFVG